MSDTSALSDVIALLKAGGPVAIVAAVAATSLVINTLLRDLPRLLPVLAVAAAALRGTAAPVASATVDHGDDDYDTPLNALRRIAAGCREACIGIGLDGRVAVFNAAAEALTGYTQEEMDGASVTLLMGPGDARAHPGHVSEYLVAHAAGRRPRLMGETRLVQLRRRDGSSVEVRIQLIHVNNGWAGVWAWLRSKPP